MKVPRSQLVPILDKLSQRLPAKKLAAETASYLLSDNRTGELDSLVRDLVSRRAENGVVEVTTVSARSLSPAAISQVKKEVKRLYPRARQIIINQHLDESQIGGVRLELPGRQLDLSVRAKLNKFKQLTVGS